MGWIHDLLNLDENGLNAMSHHEIEKLIKILKSLANDILYLYGMNEILEQRKQGRGISPENMKKLFRILSQIKKQMVQGLKAEKKIEQAERRGMSSGEIKHIKMGWIHDLLNLNRKRFNAASHDELEDLIRTLKLLALDIDPLREMDKILEQRKQGRGISPENMKKLFRILSQIKAWMVMGLKAEEKIKQVEEKRERPEEKRRRQEEENRRWDEENRKRQEEERERYQQEQAKKRQLERHKEEELGKNIYRAAEASDSPEPLLNAWQHTMSGVFGELPATRRIVPHGIYDFMWKVINDNSLPFQARKRIGLYVLKAFGDVYGEYYGYTQYPHTRIRLEVPSLNLDSNYLDDGNLRGICRHLYEQETTSEDVKKVIARLFSMPYSRQHVALVCFGVIATSELSAEQISHLIISQDIW